MTSNDLHQHSQIAASFEMCLWLIKKRSLLHCAGFSKNLSRPKKVEHDFSCDCCGVKSHYLQPVEESVWLCGECAQDYQDLF